MKKLIISVLLIAIPTISNAAKDCSLVACPDGQTPNPVTCICESNTGIIIPNPDLPITPELCPGVACEAGYELDYRSCECVTGLPTLPDTPLDPDIDITEEECIQLNGASTWQTYSLDSTKKYREAHNWVTNKCTSRHVAACADNYYGTQYASNTETGAIAGVTCTPCPDGGKSVGPVGILSAPNTSITSCYLPANTTYTEPSGTYTYTDECYYK